LNLASKLPDQHSSPSRNQEVPWSVTDSKTGKNITAGQTEIGDRKNWPSLSMILSSMSFGMLNLWTNIAAAAEQNAARLISFFSASSEAHPIVWSARMKLILSPRDWCYCSSLLLCVLVFLFLSISLRSNSFPVTSVSRFLFPPLCLAFPFFFSLFFLSSIWPLFSILFSLLSSGFFFLFFLICCSFLCIYRQSGRRSPYLVQVQDMVAHGFPGFLYQGGRGLCQGERERKWAGKKDFEKHSSLHHIIKSNPGVDPAKGPGPGFHGSTRVNPEKLKKKLKF